MVKCSFNSLISIIVPVYNVEDKLERCVHSLLSQTYNNIEIILIDDGSYDKSGFICDNLLSEDSRIKVIHQKNHGVSYARNVGIDSSIGEYICFVDSDDFVEKNYIENFIIGLKNTTDLVFQGINEIKGNNQIIKKVPKECYYLYENVLEGIADINQCSMFGYVCNKLYKRKILIDKNIRFNLTINISEDRIFALQYIKYVNEMSVVAASAYNYEILTTGLTLRKREFKDLKIAADANLEAAQTLLCERQSERFLYDTKRAYIMASIGYLNTMFINKTPISAIINEINYFKNKYLNWLNYYIPVNNDQKMLYLSLKLPTCITILLLKVYWFLKKIKNGE